MSGTVKATDFKFDQSVTDPFKLSKRPSEQNAIGACKDSMTQLTDDDDTWRMLQQCGFTAGTLNNASDIGLSDYSLSDYNYRMD